MEEIKAGDYVRTCQGDIGKVSTITSTGIIIEDERHIHFDSITKHSPNIIDVIEVGDYVNGKRVEGIDDKEFYDHREIFFENECWYIKDYHIESIVTHEQFNSIKYEVI